jgi:hypothetical protein
MRPFASWSTTGNSPDWYQAYDASKHDRKDDFQQANLRNVVDAVAGLLVLLTSQFGNEDFSSDPRSLILIGSNADGFTHATGSLFRIKQPDNWADDEKYDFDWSKLKTEADRFRKIDYDQP